MSTYKREGDTITIQMSCDEYSRLLMALGMVTGAAHNKEMMNFLIRVVNSLNRENPEFIPYDVPAAKPLP